MDSYVDVVFNKTVHSNSTDNYDEVEASRINHEAVIVPLVFLTIFLTGVTGNAAILYLVGKYRELKTVPYMLILNLAIADLLINIICVPFTSTIYIFDSWQFGTFVCKLNEYLQTVVVSVSIFTLSALSIERFLTVSRSENRDPVRNRRYVLLTIAGTWLLAFLFGLPDLISANVVLYEHAEESIAVCITQPTSQSGTYTKVIIIIKFLYLFILPMCIITIFYSLIAIKLCCIKSDEPMPYYTGETPKNSLVDRVAKKGNVQKRRLHLARLVLSLVLVFVICWLPRHIYVMWYHFSPDLYNAFWHYFKIIAFCLTFGMSAVNPVVIYCLDGVLQRRVRGQLPCCSRDDRELEPLEEGDMELSILATTDHPDPAIV